MSSTRPHPHVSRCRLPVLLAVLGITLPAGTAHPQSPKDAEPSRRVYVPVEELDAILARDNRGVLLPKEEFESLLNQARRNAAGQPRRPADVLIHSVEYNARTQGDMLLLKAEVRFTQFSDGWTSLPLPLANLSLERALLGETPAKLGRAPSTDKKVPGHLVLLHDAPGTAVLHLELSTPLTAAGSDKLASFGLIPAPSADLQIQLPAGKHLLVDGLSLQRPDGVDEAAYTVPVGGRNEITLRLTDRTDDLTTDSLLLATTAYGLNVSPGEVSWRAQSSLQIFGQKLDRLVFTVPRTLEIATVESTGLEDWELTDDTEDDTRTVVTLNYRQPFDGSQSVTLTGVMSTNAGEPWSVPALVVRNATSHVGRILLQYPAGVRIRVVSAQGVREAVPEVRPTPNANNSSKTAPDPVTARQLFDVWRENFTLSLIAQPRQRELHAALSTVLEVGEHGLTLISSANVNTYFAPLFDLDLTIPAEWAVESVTVGGAAVEWLVLPQEAGTHRIRIPLPEPLKVGAATTLVVRTHRDPEGWPPEADPVLLDLPEVRIPQLDVVEGIYVVKADADLEIVPEDVTGLDRALTGVEGERLGYVYQDTVFAGRLRVERRPAQLAARTLAFSRIDRRTVFTHLESQLTISGGGLRAVQCLLPEALGEDLRFHLVEHTARIVEQQPMALDDGTRIWTLIFDRRVQGEVTLSVQTSQPRPESDELTLPTLQIRGADRENGFVAVEAAGDQLLNITAVDAENQNLPEVDPADLPHPHYTPQERVVGAYRYNRPGHRVTVTVERFDRLPVPVAVCHELQITSTLGRTGEFQHEAAFRVTAVGVQSLLLELPGDSGSGRGHLWAVLLDGEPVEIRQTPNGYLIPLATTGDDATRPRTLQAFYRTQIPPLSSLGRVRQQPPQLSVPQGDDLQPVEILEQNWTLYYPDETLLTDSFGEFAPQSPLDYRSVLSALRDGFSSRLTKERWTTAAAVVGTTVLVLLVLVMLYRRLQHVTMPPTIKAILAIGVSVILVGMCLITLMLPSVQQSREAARRTAARNAERARDMVLSTSEAFDDEAAATRAEPSAAPAAPEAALEEFAQPQAAADESTRRGASQREGQAGNALTFSRNSIANGGEALFGDRSLQFVDPNRQMLAQDSDMLFPAPTSGPAAETAGAAAPSGGLLSLSLDISRPAESDEKSFRYAGTQTAQAGVGLDLVYEDRTAGDLRCWLTAVVVAGLLWVLRNTTPGTRAFCAALGITLPIGLTPVVPAAAAIFLDGVFLGTIAGIVLWMLRSLLHWSTAALTQPRPHAKTAQTATLLVAALLGGTADSRADEPAATKKPQPRETSIVIPYDAGTDPLKAARVFLPHDQFLKLWNLAHPDKQRRPVAPVDALVAEARYEVELAPAEDDARRHALVHARLVLTNLRESQSTVPLPFGPVAIESATLNGEAAPLLSRPKDRMAPFAVVLAEEGNHVLDVVFRIPAQISGPAGRWLLPLRPVPTGLLRFTLPQNDLLVRINGSESAYRRVQEDGAEVIVLPIDNGIDVGLSWQPRETHGDVDRIVHAEATTAASVSDAGIRITTQVVLRVPQGNINEQSFLLPSDLRLQQIAGPDVGGWEFNGNEGERQLKVFFRRTVGDGTTLRFDLFLETAPPTGAEPLAVNLPTVAPTQVTRNTGHITVYAENHLAVRSGQTSGLIQINPTDFQAPAELRSTGQPVLAYRFVAPAFELPLQITRRQPRSTATAMHFANVERRKIRLSGRIGLQILEAPRSTLAFQIPDNFLPLEISATHLNDWTVVSRDDGGRLLLVELDAPRTGNVQVSYQGTIPRDPAAAQATVDVPQLLDVSRLVSHLAIAVDPVYSATLSSFDGWGSLDPETLPGELKSSKANIRFGFISNRTLPSPVELALTRGEPRFETRVATVITVAETLVNYTLALNWQVSQAAADTFSFSAPSTLAGKLTFDRTGIRQITEIPGDDGRTTWTITLHEPVTGRLFLLGTADLPPASQQIETPHVQFLRDGEPLPEQQQFVLLINQSFGQLQLDNANSVTAVTAEALLPITINQSLVDQAAEIVQIRDSVEMPAWNIRRFAEQRTAAASVNVAFLATTIAHDGTWRTGATYQVRNRSRQFLALRLPEGSRMLSVFVAGRPARPVEKTLGDAPVHLLALPKTSQADLSFPVTCVIEGSLAQTLPRGFQPVGREFDLPAPEVVSQNESAEFGIPVARTEWKVYLPDDVDAVPLDDTSRTNLSRTTEDSATAAYTLNLLQETANLFDVISSAKTKSQRYRAIDNLKQIELAVKATRANQVAQAEEGRQIQQLQSQLAGAYSKLNAGDTPQASQQGVPGQSDRDFYVLDDGVAKDTVIMNNAMIIIENSGNGIRLAQPAEKAEIVPHFDLDFDADRNGIADQKSPTAGRTLDRQRLQQFNFEQLETLNEQLARSKTASEIQPQTPPQPPAAQVDARFGVPAPQRASGQAGTADEPTQTRAAVASTPQAAESRAAGWTAVGGLSLPIEVPRDAQQLDFSKVGGSPKLALAIRPRRTAEFGLGLVWTAVWLVIGIGVALAVARATGANAIAHGLIVPLIVAGLLAMLVAPLPLNVIGGFLFIAGAAIYAFRTA